MRLIFASILLTCFAIALGGCSVFGIATKSELQAAIDQENADQAVLENRLFALEDRLQTARAELDAMDQRLTPQLAAMDETLDRHDAELAEATQQWRAMQGVLVTHLDSLRTEFALVERDVAQVREGMGLVSAQAEGAQLLSREAMRVHHHNLLAEKDRLQARLTELEAQLQAWSEESAAAVAPAQAAETSRLDIRAITPEQPDAAVAGGGES